MVDLLGDVLVPGLGVDGERLVVVLQVAARVRRLAQQLHLLGASE